MNRIPGKDPLLDHISSWRAHIDREISEADIKLDLLDIYQRAQWLNPQGITKQDLAEADHLCSIAVETEDNIRLASELASELGSDPGDATLAPFFRDWKAEIDNSCEQSLRDRSQTFEHSQQSPKKKWKQAVALSLSMAAAAAGIWFVPQLKQLGPMLRSQPAGMQHSVNLVDRPVHHQYSQARHFTAAKSSFFDEAVTNRSRQDELQFLDQMDFLDRLESNEVFPNQVSTKHEPEREEKKAEEHASTKTMVKVKRPREARLRALDRKARDFWKQGNIEQAQKAFVRLTRIGGRTKLAELAFGDLFALAREYADLKMMRALWKQYLRRFPHGIFAQDARAGLCRHRRSTTEMQACWHDYLQQHPRGTHYKEARLHARGGATEQK